nr:hypothetical protein [Tanacetum cinerariifolium]
MDLFNLIRAPNPTKGATAPEIPSSEDIPATVASGVGQAEEAATMDPPSAQESRKRGYNRADVNAPSKSLRRDYADPQPSGSSRGRKSLAAIQLGLTSFVVPKDVPVGVSDPDPVSFADAPSRHPADVAQSSQGITAAGDSGSENVSSPVEVGSPRSVYRLEWGITNGSLLDTPEACQDLVDHAAPPGYFFELRHMHNEEFLGQYNINLARIQARELEIKNLEARLETEAGMKKATKDKTEDERVEQRCTELDARLDELSIDFDEELYPHMLTAIAGRRRVIGHGLRLAMMKCAESLEMRQAFADVVSAGVAKGMSEGLKHGLEHGHAQLKVESIEAYDPEAEAKFVAALQSLKDLKYPLLDQLEGLKDAPMDVIMAALYMESDTGEDASQYIRDLRPSSSQLTIPVYPEVRDPRHPWAYKEEIKLSDAITANITRAEKKKKCCIVCRTHGVGSAHHARSDGIPVSVPMVVPRGLALLLVDAATQTDLEDLVFNVFYAPWESWLFPNVLGIALRTQSPRPLGLQPAYAANHVQRYMAPGYS